LRSFLAYAKGQNSKKRLILAVIPVFIHYLNTKYGKALPVILSHTKRNFYVSDCILRAKRDKKMENASQQEMENAYKVVLPGRE
jgi:predicted nucleic acid-binding protein